MYYRGVNRGVSFTKSGRYTIGLVILLGFIATGSGFNSLYLSLSFGLGVLIISGLQSEKVMKNYELLSARDTTADADTPFNFELKARNKSKSFYLYGVENLLVTKVPKFRLFSTNLDTRAAATVLSLPSGKEVSFSGSCGGMQRGLYSEFYVVQRTTFPFGLLSKFKVSPLTGNICILPKKNAEVEKNTRELLQKKLASDHREKQFYSHRSYLSGDSLRHIDWKKSAGLKTQFWSLKSYESSGEDTGILLDLNWGSISASSSETEYEAFLSAARTIADVAHELEKPLILKASDRWVCGLEDTLKYLASAPKFENRAAGFGYQPRSNQPGGKYLVVRVGVEGAVVDDLNAVVVV